MWEKSPPSCEGRLPARMEASALAASAIQASFTLPWESQCTIAVTLRVRDLALA